MFPIGDGDGAGSASPRGRTLGDAKPDRTIRLASPLAQAFGGRLPLVGVVLVSGVPKAGKSTQAARVALELLARGWIAQLADGEMSEGRAHDTWARGVPEGDTSSLSRVERVHVRTMADVRAAVKRSRPRVVVLDSLHAVCDGGDRARELKELAHTARELWIVIGQARGDGRVHGGHALEHWADGVAVVTREGIEVVGCRWANV